METLTEQLEQVLSENSDADPELDELDAAGEETPEGEDPEVDAEEGESEIRTIAELAEANGWNPDDLYALEVGIAGQDGVPLGQIKDAMQQLEVERDTLQNNVREQALQLQQVQQQAQQAGAADQQMQQMSGQMAVLQNYMYSPDLAKLKEDDPGAAALKVQEVQQAIGNLDSQMRQYQGNLEAQRQQARQQNLMGGQNYLRQQIPEWRDPRVEQTDKQEIAQAIVGAGFSPEDVKTIQDPRVVMLMRELVMHRRNATGKGKVAAKKVQQSPRRSLTGGRLSRGAAGTKRADKLASRARNTGDRGDILAAARALTGVSK